MVQFTSDRVLYPLRVKVGEVMYVCKSNLWFSEFQTESP